MVVHVDWTVTTKGEGLDAIRWIREQATHDMAAAVYAEAEVIMTDSKENYVPVLTGNLKRTGHVPRPEVTSQGVTVKLSYGGPYDGAVAPYAFRVHERDPSIGQGKNLYLWRPVTAALPELERRIGARMIQRAQWLGR